MNRLRRWPFTATKPRKPGTFANTVLLARRMVERGVRFVQMYTTIGIRTPTLPAGCRCNAATSIRRATGLIQDLKAARPVGRNARDLGRRVRPHHLLAGRLTKDEYGRDHHPRVLHHVDGRRRHRSRGRSTAKPTTSPTTSSKIQSTSATSTPPCYDCWASITNGSPIAIRGLIRS